VDLPGIYFPQHFLYFFPLPQGQGSLRPTFGAELRMRWTTSWSSGAARLTGPGAGSGEFFGLGGEGGSEMPVLRQLSRIF
jgi:hypothetical protein